jgi:photosystem II stability/assembly factor-like uncharacterized protein
MAGGGMAPSMRSKLSSALLLGIALGSLMSSQANPVLTPGTWVNITPQIPGTCFSTANMGGYCNDIAIDPSNPSVLYVCSAPFMAKSTDAGSTWSTINGNYFNSAGMSYVNPKNSQNLYVICGVNTTGFFVSKDAGKTWFQPASFDTGARSTWVNDIYWIAPDPTNFGHILMTFHSPWNAAGYSGHSGVLEGWTTDEGVTWTWKPHFSSTWSAGLAVAFLWDPAKGIGDSLTWLVGTQWDGGYFRTSDGGTTWKNVSTQMMMHAGTHIYYSKTGVLYSGANQTIMRSTDNGITWKNVGPSTQDGYYQVMGDGDSMYAQPANTGSASSGAHPFLVSAENDGINWKPYNSQTWTNGPHAMVFDATNRIIYSAHDCPGVWALKSPPKTSGIHTSSNPRSAGTVSLPARRQMMVSDMAGMKKSGATGCYDIRGRMVAPSRLLKSSVIVSVR